MRPTTFIENNKNSNYNSNNDGNYSNLLQNICKATKLVGINSNYNISNNKNNNNNSIKIFVVKKMTKFGKRLTLDC